MRFSIRALLVVTFVVAVMAAIIPPLLPYSALYLLMAVSGAGFAFWIWSLVTRQD